MLSVFSMFSGKKKKVVTFSVHNTVASVTAEGITEPYKVQVPADVTPLHLPPPAPCQKAVRHVVEEALSTALLRDLNRQWISFVPFRKRDSGTLTAFFALHRSMIEDFVVKVFDKRYKGEYAESPCKRVVLTSFWERVYARMTTDTESDVIRVQSLVRGWIVRHRLEQEEWDQAFAWSRGL